MPLSCSRATTTLVHVNPAGWEAVSSLAKYVMVQEVYWLQAARKEVIRLGEEQYQELKEFFRGLSKKDYQKFERNESQDPNRQRYLSIMSKLLGQHEMKSWV